MRKILFFVVTLLFTFLLRSPVFAQGASTPEPSGPPFDCDFKLEAYDNGTLLGPGGKYDERTLYLNKATDIIVSFDMSKIPESFWDEQAKINGVPELFTHEMDLNVVKGEPLDYASVGSTLMHCDEEFTGGELPNQNTYKTHRFQTDYGIDTTFTPGTCELPRDIGTFSAALYYREGKAYPLLCRADFSVITENSLKADILIEPLNPLQDTKTEWKVTVSNVSVPENSGGKLISFWLDNEELYGGIATPHPRVKDGSQLPLPHNFIDIENVQNGNIVSFTLNPLEAGAHYITVKYRPHLGWTRLVDDESFTVVPEGAPTPTVPIPTAAPVEPLQCIHDPQCGNHANCAFPCNSCSWCTTRQRQFNPVQPDFRHACDRLGDSTPEEKKFKAACLSCNKDSQIWTAIGCISTDYGSFINIMFPLGLSFGGATSFLYFLYGAFLFLTSAGNQERIAEARQIIMSAISGVLLIIFSILILKLVAVDILDLPEFGGSSVQNTTNSPVCSNKSAQANNICTPPYDVCFWCQPDPNSAAGLCNDESGKIARASNNCNHPYGVCSWCQADPNSRAGVCQDESGRQARSENRCTPPFNICSWCIPTATPTKKPPPKIAPI